MIVRMQIVDIEELAEDYVCTDCDEPFSTINPECWHSEYATPIYGFKCRVCHYVDEWSALYIEKADHQHPTYACRACPTDGCGRVMNYSNGYICFACVDENGKAPVVYLAPGGPAYPFNAWELINDHRRLMHDLRPIPIGERQKWERARDD